MVPARYIAIALLTLSPLSAQNNITNMVMSPPPPLKNSKSPLHIEKTTPIDKTMRYNECMAKSKDTGKCLEESKNYDGKLKVDIFK